MFYLLKGHYNPHISLGVPGAENFHMGFMTLASMLSVQQLGFRVPGPFPGEVACKIRIHDGNNISSIPTASTPHYYEL